MLLTTYGWLLTQGLLVTIGTWLLTGIFALLLGITLGVLSCQKWQAPWIYRFIRSYSFVAKGIPAYVQILIAYYLLPQLVGFQLSAFVCAVFALIFCSTGYLLEIVRGAVNAVPLGQWEAAQVLGYSPFCTVRYIVLPQAIVMVRQALIGEFEQLLKTTSLLATIGITELTYTATNIISRELNPLPVYGLIAGIYLLCSAGFVFFVARIERYFF